MIVEKQIEEVHVPILIEELLYDIAVEEAEKAAERKYPGIT